MTFEKMLNLEDFRTDSNLQYTLGSYYESIIERDSYYEDETAAKAFFWYKKAIEGGQKEAETALARLIAQYPVLSLPELWDEIKL